MPENWIQILHWLVQDVAKPINDNFLTRNLPQNWFRLTFHIIRMPMKPVFET